MFSSLMRAHSKRSWSLRLLLALAIVAILTLPLICGFHGHRTGESPSLSATGSPGATAVDKKGGGDPGNLDEAPASQSPASGTLTGDAAKAELEKRGLYDSLGAAFAAAQLAVTKIDPAAPNSRGADYFASNPNQKLLAWFGKNGIELASGSKPVEGEEPWTVQVRLQGVGRNGVLAEESGRSISANGAQVQIAGSSGLVNEWYENRGEGIEHGFTVKEAPRDRSGPLEVVLAVAGTLRAQAVDDGTDAGGVKFVSANGSQVVSYRALRAWDATGRSLPARMEVRGENELALVADDTGAQYPVTVDPIFANSEARLLEESTNGDNLGTSVALGGDTALVGAPYHSTLNSSDSGSAYVFVRTGTLWTQQAELTAIDGNGGDQFGCAVALSADGNIALIGAQTHSGVGDEGFLEGGAYVYVRNATLWTQQAELMGTGGNFGASVALSADGVTALVGATFHSTPTSIVSGSAYVFVQNLDVWTQQAELTGSNQGNDEQFGESLALSSDGNTAIIGCSNISGKECAAYVFTRTGTTWAQEAELGRGPSLLIMLGVALSADGNTALIGGTVFARRGNTWAEQTEFPNSSESGDDGFGMSVALSSDGNTALVGAPGRAYYLGDPTGAGKAYLFVRRGTFWSQQAELTVTGGAASDAFGFSVALSGDGQTALAGAPFHNIPNGEQSGSAYAFIRSGERWSQQEVLATIHGSANDVFGSSVALNADGNVALVGAPGDLHSTSAGFVYVFVQNGALWTQQAVLLASDGAAGDGFGHSVAVSGDGTTALVGAPHHGLGSAYVFAFTGGQWTLQTDLANDVDTDDDLSVSFGMAVALNGDGSSALVGAEGAANVFVRSGTAWSQQAFLFIYGSPYSLNFGSSVALSGDGNTALIGASGLESSSLTAYVFARNGTLWTQQAELAASDGVAADYFGYSVALSNDGATALVGAPFSNAGSAYIFVQNETVWTQQAELMPGDGVGGLFGYSVALSADGYTALVGAPFDGASGPTLTGSAYVFAADGPVWSPGPELTSGFFSSYNEQFGTSVNLGGVTALVGAPYASTAAGDSSGSVFVFQIGELPEIVTQPQSQTVIPGQSVTFSVTATGYAPLQYQWRDNGNSITGATGPSYTIPSVQDTDQGNYDVVVSNIGGVVTSAAASLGVNDLSVFSQIQPGPSPDANGFVLVNLTPTNITTGWCFAGEEEWRASGVPAGGLASGDYTVQYQPVPGYTQPPDELVSVVSGAPATVLDRTYRPIGNSPTGSIVVTLLPASLAGTAWRFRGDTSWNPSGTGIDGLSVGTYLIECEPVAGQSTPVPAAALVQAGVTTQTVITYYVADSPTGTQPSLIPFATATSSPGLPYNYLGQIRTDVGEGTGFVVTTRVVVTAGHVVFDDGTFSYATNLQWLFQLDTVNYEPVPLIPQGTILMSGYAAEREAEDTPGVSAPASQNLDAAVLYFLSDAARGGSGGYLAGEATPNEWLVSGRQMILAGYPVDGIPAAEQGEMFATAPLNITFTQAYLETYQTTGVTSVGGMSGAPLSVQYDNGQYYPAAIYLGGTNETLVRAIDSDVVQLITQANTSANGGNNNVGGGVTLASENLLAGMLSLGSIQVTIAPASAITAGAQWSIQSSGLSPSPQQSGATLSNISPGSYSLEFNSVAGFQPPEVNTVNIVGGQQLNITFTYAELAPVISSAGSQTGTNGQPFDYQISASGDPSSYFVYGTLPAGVTFDPVAGLISGTPSLSGKFTVTVKASNETGSGTKAVSLIVDPAVAAQVATVSSGQPLTYQFISSETSAVFADTQNLLPTVGLSLDTSTGIISGTPTVSDETLVAPISVTVNGASATAPLTLYIGPALNQNGNASLSGQIGQSFDSTPLSTAAAGVMYMASGLPPGLSINSTTGEITGKPSASGIYAVVISATDANGTTQQMLAITINSILTVNTPTDGRVFQVINGAASKTPIGLTSVQAPGEGVTLEAVPAHGYYFAGWIGLGAAVSTDPLTFTQADGLDITAIFRPFADYQGAYVGLVQQAAPTHATSGFALVALNSTGSFTGKLLYAGVGYRLNGQINANAAPSNFTFKRHALPSLTAAVQLIGLSPISIAVNLDDGTVQSTLTAEPAPAYTKANPAPTGLPGAYTALLSATAATPGQGSATLRVTSTGEAAVVGTLPDGSPFSAAGPALPNSTFLFYVPLQSGAGSILGTLTFANDTTTDATAALRWYRPAIAKDPNFPAGWPDGVDATIEAAHYTAPRAATKTATAIPLFPILPSGGTATLTLEDTALGTNGLMQGVTISASGSLAVVPANNTNQIHLTLTPVTGLLSGSFLEPSSPHPILRTIHGAILQKANNAGGFFLAPGGGSLELVP